MHRLLATFVCAGLSVAWGAQDPLYFVPSDRVSVRVMKDIPTIDVAPGVHVHTVVGTTGAVSLGEFESGSAAVLHHHTREQADIAVTGTFDMTIGTHVEKLGPGVGVIVPPNVDHSIANKSTGVMAVVEFHTVPRPDLVPPRPAMTFPMSPEPVRVPDGRTLVVRLEPSSGPSMDVTRIVRGETCTLIWRKLPQVLAPIALEAMDKELFIYVVQGVAEWKTSASWQRVSPGTVIVIPPHERITMRAPDAAGTAFAEFTSERR